MQPSVQQAQVTVLNLDLPPDRQTHNVVVEVPLNGDIIDLEFESVPLITKQITGITEIT